MKRISTMMMMGAAAAAVAMLPAPAMAKKIRVYTQKVAAKQICGTEFARYSCSTTIPHMKLQRADIALERLGNAPNHHQVLGKFYTNLTGTAVSLSPCGPGDANPFGDSDTADKTPATTFTFEKRSKAEISAGLQADVKNALIAANVPEESLRNLEAEFKTSYRRASGAKHDISGKYYRMQLKQEVIDGIKNAETANQKARACGDMLRADGRRNLIYSIAVIELDKASYASNVATDAAASFVAKVKKKAPGADIAGLEASVKTAVTQDMTVQLGKEHRVISWDYLRI